MKLKITNELKIPGGVAQFSGDYTQQPQEYWGRRVELAGPMSVSGEYSFDGDGIRVKGRAETVLKSECAKCTKTFDEPFSFHFEERFEKQASEDDGIYGYEGDVLDIRQMVLDNLFLQMPMISYCKEDCKGLCPLCGCDLNMTQCDCVVEEEEEIVHNPLAALRTLLNDDKEV